MLSLCVENVDGKPVSQELITLFSKYDHIPEYARYEYIQGQDWEADATALLDLLERRQEIEDSLKRVRNRLIERADGHNVISHGISVSKVKRKGCIDYKAIPELLGVDLEPYRGDPMEYFKVSRIFPDVKGQPSWVASEDVVA